MKKILKKIIMIFSHININKESRLIKIKEGEVYRGFYRLCYMGKI
ncbi:hypothetical protein [Borreliella bavariensis]|nr:hypothetical protein [Borreliella bavariensis]